MSNQPQNESSIDEAIAKEKKLQEEEGSKDIRAVMIDYAKRYNGFPYISASRLECLVDPKSGDKPSFLCDQLMTNFLIRNSKNPKILDDFMATFANGELVFIQAHAEMPTLCKDGLYNSLDINGKYIKTQLCGYFKIAVPDPVETDDRVSVKDFKYFYKDQNNMFMDLFVNEGISLDAYRDKHNTLFKAPAKPSFDPFIVIKKGDGKGGFSYGMLVGNPYHEITAAEAAAILKEQSERHGGLKVDQGPVETEEEQ